MSSYNGRSTTDVGQSCSQSGILSPPVRRGKLSRFISTAKVLAFGSLLVPMLAQNPAYASDHADTAENVARIGADITDLFVFPSPRNPNNVVMALNVRGLIPSGEAG